VRLGEGVALSGALCGDAIDRTLGALQVCAAKIGRQGVTRARHIATEACRRACNGEDFLGLVNARTGLAFEVIAPAEEARLALAGCEALLDPQTPFALLVDIGGGSTEVSWVKVGRCAQDRLQSEIVDMTSIPWGVVTLTEACVSGQPRDRAVGRPAYQEMVERIRSDLRPFCARHGIGHAIARGEVQMVGASGTVTTVSAHNLGLRRYNRTTVDGSRIAHEQVLRICGQLSLLSVSELTAWPCIGDDRAELALAGGAILEAVCRQWPTPSVRVADRGLREGVLMDLMRQADREADPLTRRDC
jgi:exopolyphosphatase/guanosine-5'-triphosphate,3'-diphosphate pyrophosphatase